MLSTLLLALAQDPLQVLEAGVHGRPVAVLIEEARQLDARHEHLRAAADTPLGAAARRDATRAAYGALLGPLPARTPLEITVVGTLTADGYRVERLHYQSRPGHHVTALLYVPDGPGPFPGVAVPCGHSANGKAYESYQLACALLARSGMMALCYDPVGQGERHQVDLDRHGTTEHELTNAAGLLVGEPLPKHELWDGMRAIDVLLERGARPPIRHEGLHVEVVRSRAARLDTVARLHELEEGGGAVRLAVADLATVGLEQRTRQRG